MNRIPRDLAIALAAATVLVAAAWGVAGGVDGAVSTAMEHSTAPKSTEVVAAPRLARGNRRAPNLVVDPETTTPVPVTETPVVLMRPTRTRRAPAARGEALPRSVHVLQVPVPSTLPDGRPVLWTMRPGSRAEVLSSTAGTVASDTPDSLRAITVVTRVPARAAAGVLPVGEAEFVVDSESVVVPIELVVERVRRVAIAPTRATYGALSGQRLTLTAEVRNLGNAADTIEVAVVTPSGWQRSAVQRVSLLPGERRVVSIETRVPAGTGRTAAYPQAEARLGGQVAASAVLPVQVEDPTERQRPVGPSLVVGTSSSFGDTLPGAPVVDLSLRGAIRSDVTVIGRAGFVTDEARTDRRALSRAGTYLGGAFLAVRGPGWYGTAGNTGMTLSPLTGIGAYGVGASGGFLKDRVQAAGMLTGIPDGNGVHGGARVDFQIQRHSVGVAASHFRDAGPSGRSLDAVSLIGTLSPGRGFRITGEGAARRFNGGEGIGGALNIERITRTDLMTLLVGHSPGGSQAFGRAVNDASVAWAHRFGERLTLQSNLFRSSDKLPSDGSEFDADGWSVGPRYSLRPDLQLELDVRHSAFDSRSGAGGGFASTDFSTSSAIRKIGGRFQWTAGLNIGSTERTNTLSNGTKSTLGVSRYGVGGGGSVVLPVAVLSAGMDYSRSGAGAGFAPQQGRITLGASRIALFNAPRAPILRAEAEITTWFGERASATVARIGSEVPLPGEFALTLDAERNPMIRPAGEKVPWILAVRLERGFTLGWAARTPMTRGSVFQDRNGNGVRDPEEDGLAGVLIRQGSNTAVTDASGRFALQGQDQIPIEVDPVTLPQGVVAPNVAPGGAGRPVSLGLVPTGAVEVRLVPVTDELGRRPEGKLEELAIIAKDERGAEWYLRADSTGRVRFDALPPGHYTFTLDFAGTTERLRQVGDPVVLDVKPGLNLPPLEVRFAPRAARLFNGGQGTSSGGRRR